MKELSNGKKWHAGIVPLKIKMRGGRGGVSGQEIDFGTNFLFLIIRTNSCIPYRYNVLKKTIL